MSVTVEQPVGPARPAVAAPARPRCRPGSSSSADPARNPAKENAIHPSDGWEHAVH